MHGGGIDQPLVVYRYSASANAYAWVGIVPFPNWQGSYEAGVIATGSAKGLTTEQCAPGTGGCPAITWPGAKRADGEKIDKFSVPSTVYWNGNLLSGRSDNSGLQYRRNRYYDPGSGRFTQSDPIGLAGGTNAYGFASGDPVNYVDPFGESVCVGGNNGAERFQNARDMMVATNTTFVPDAQGCSSHATSSQPGLRSPFNQAPPPRSAL